MRHVLTRQQLYDMIWERAVSKVAPELGISDVALRKQCVKHAIPLPGATYWGRLHAGRPVKPKPLGAAPKGVSDRIVIDARAKPPAPQPVEAAIAVASLNSRLKSRFSPSSVMPSSLAANCTLFSVSFLGCTSIWRRPSIPYYDFTPTGEMRSRCSSKLSPRAGM